MHVLDVGLGDLHLPNVCRGTTTGTVVTLLRSSVIHTGVRFIPGARSSIRGFEGFEVGVWVVAAGISRFTLNEHSLFYLYSKSPRPNFVQFHDIASVVENVVLDIPSGTKISSLQFQFNCDIVFLQYTVIEDRSKRFYTA